MSQRDGEHHAGDRMQEHHQEQDQEADGQSPATARGDGQARTAAEWTTLGISAALLLAVVGLLTFLQVTGGDSPAMFTAEARLDEVRHEAGLYYVPVEVRNRGDKTAGDVLVQAELETGSGAPVTAEFTITFLAGGERAHGTVVFVDDPRQGKLTVQATSYLEP